MTPDEHKASKIAESREIANTIRAINPTNTQMQEMANTLDDFINRIEQAPLNSLEETLLSIEAVAYADQVMKALK